LRYGTFIGDADPITGSGENSPADLLGFAQDRIEDEALTQDQLLGVIEYANDAIRALACAVCEHNPHAENSSLCNECEAGLEQARCAGQDL
jgi:hypothetical protein